MYVCLILQPGNLVHLKQKIRQIIKNAHIELKFSLYIYIYIYSGVK